MTGQQCAGDGQQRAQGVACEGYSTTHGLCAHSRTIAARGVAHGSKCGLQDDYILSERLHNRGQEGTPKDANLCLIARAATQPRNDVTGCLDDARRQAGRTFSGSDRVMHTGASTR